jgi:hypothetical protein
MGKSLPDIRYHGDKKFPQNVHINRDDENVDL